MSSPGTLCPPIPGLGFGGRRRTAIAPRHTPRPHLLRIAGIIFHMAQVMGRTPVRIRARFFEGLADPARLVLLDALRDGERTAGDAATVSGLSPSNASKHLACLRECGLVESRQDWRRVYYRLSDGVARILDAHDALVEHVADTIAACERPEM